MFQGSEALSPPFHPYRKEPTRKMFGPSQISLPVSGCLFLLLGFTASQSFQTLATPKPLSGVSLQLAKETSIAIEAKRAIRSLPPRITGPVTFPSACFGYNSIVNVCISLSTRFTNYPASDQASCLCYISTSASQTEAISWRPQSFDRSISNCAAQLSTRNASDYRVFTSYDDFCSRVGDVTSTTNLFSTSSRSGVGPSNTPSFSLPGTSKPTATSTAGGPIGSGTNLPGDVPKSGTIQSKCGEEKTQS